MKLTAVDHFLITRCVQRLIGSACQHNLSQLPLLNRQMS